MVYLDYNATAPVRPEARAAMAECLGEPLNPSSVHSLGRKGRGIVEAARKTIAQSLSAFPHEVFFCASGTEANNWALKGFPERRVLASAVEHASVLCYADALIPVDENGIIRLEELERAMADEKPALVSLMLANNETGALQPVAKAAAICRAHGALLHCDAAQAFGKIPVDCGVLGADMLTLSAHKCGGPPGAAALVVRGELPVAPLLQGGGQESRRRAGTENVAAIAGFAKAVELFDFGHMKILSGWLDAMVTACSQLASPSPLGGEGWGGGQPPATWMGTPHLNPPPQGGRKLDYLPNTRMLLMPGVSNEVQLMAFDLVGIAVSAGSACASGRIEPSHVLAAMGIPDEAAKTALRVSGGWDTKEADIQRFTEEWLLLRQRLSAPCAA